MSSCREREESGGTDSGDHSAVYYAGYEMNRWAGTCMLTRVVDLSAFS